MIVDAASLFTDPKINLTYPSQLLTVLQTLKRPLFVLFVPSASDKSPPDPSVNWGGNELEAYDRVNKEFDRGPTPRYLAVLEVGSKDDWKSPENIIKSRWKITTCPLLLRLQLTTLPTHEVGILTAQFTNFRPLPIHLRFFKRGDISHLPTNHNLYKTQIYDTKTSSIGGVGVGAETYDGWEYKFNFTSGLHNKLAKQQMAKVRYHHERRRWMEQMVRDMGFQQVLSRSGGGKNYSNKVPDKNLAPSIIETEGGGHFLHRVETVGSSYQASEPAVVGRVEPMVEDSDDDDDDDEEKAEEELRRKQEARNRWYMPRGFEGGGKPFGSVVESGAEAVDFEKRFEVLQSEVDIGEAEYVRKKAERERETWKKGG